MKKVLLCTIFTCVVTANAHAETLAPPWTYLGIQLSSHQLSIIRQAQGRMFQVRWLGPNRAPGPQGGASPSYSPPPRVRR